METWHKKGRGMAKIGYARISTIEQNKDLQINALEEAGCTKIFTDEISGSKAERKGLSEALAFLRPGDALTVWKLDRAGRSLKNLIELLNLLKDKQIEFVSLTEKIDTSTPSGRLIFHMTAAFAEFERDLIRERTYEGLKAARARGRKGGRPNKIRNGKATIARKMFEDKSNSIDDICETLNVSRSTLYRYMRSVQA
jgi:DNA invertase Pin-like site-specific DNA recombinase